MEWPREKRYQPLSEADPVAYEAYVAQVADSRYRQTFHIQPPSGLLNDPNGLSYYKGRYHVFYQWFPLGPVHGIKYWYHLSSEDLVNWQDEGMALAPDTAFDSHGVFSGSALVKDDQLHLFYTGNTRDANWVRYPYQCRAIMDESGQIVKCPQPFIGQVPPGYTDNFRDPKVFETGQAYICLVGAETTAHQGRVVYYRSDDLEDWTFGGEIAVTPYDNAGFMWECPDYFELSGQGILLFSPQGMSADGDAYQNIFQSGYLMGPPLDFQAPVMAHQGFQELDKGFDFYAPQTFLDGKGRRILIGWLGLPGVDCVTDEEGWAHCLTIPRQLEVKAGQLYQRPVEELKALRQAKVEARGWVTDEHCVLPDAPRYFEWQIEADLAQATCFGVKFRCGEGEETVFYYDKASQTLVLDKTQSGPTVTEAYGLVRRTPCHSENLTLQLFVDESSVEIFVNDGQTVFTSRLYSSLTSNGIEVFATGRAAFSSQLWALQSDSRA